MTYIRRSSLVTSLCEHSGWLRARERAKPTLWTHCKKLHWVYHRWQFRCQLNAELHVLSQLRLCLFLYALVLYRVLFSFSLSFIRPFYASCFCPLVILCLIVCVFLLLFFFPSPYLCSLCYPLYNYFYWKIIKIRKTIVYFYTIFILSDISVCFYLRD